MRAYSDLTVEERCEINALEGVNGLFPVRKMIDRGDFSSPDDLDCARKWLQREEEFRNAAWLRIPEGSAVRAADAAERTAKVAFDTVEVARDASKSAKKSANWTMIAAFFAAAGALSPVIQTWLASRTLIVAPSASISTTQVQVVKSPSSTASTSKP